MKVWETDKRSGDKRHCLRTAAQKHTLPTIVDANLAIEHREACLVPMIFEA